jgi:hypothetical protein
MVVSERVVLPVDALDQGVPTLGADATNSSEYKIWTRGGDNIIPVDNDYVMLPSDVAPLLPGKMFNFAIYKLLWWRSEEWV